jgi:hypothetical protein
MPSLDSLPGDQRAVLQLVVGRGRSYEEIARMLSMNPAAVRDRALAALAALGPQSGVSMENQARITDYLLGQLSQQDADEVRDLLAESPSERAWAGVLSSELALLSSGPLPEIPVERSAPLAEPEPPITPPPPHPPAAEIAAPTGLGPHEEPAKEQEPADEQEPAKEQEPADEQEPAKEQEPAD